MSKQLVSIIDYGMGNLLSVRRAFEYLGAQVEFINTPNEIEQAQCLVLPGVGAFAQGMYELEKRELIDAIRSFALSDKKLLGICLGAQMLLDESHEFGVNQGLGLIPGTVEAIPTASANGDSLKVPHMGWSDLVPANAEHFEHPLFRGINPGEPFYFVHSYHCQPSSKSHLIAQIDYAGNAINAVIGENNLFGCQCHPEKSGPAGLRLLQNFLEQAA